MKKYFDEQPTTRDEQVAVLKMKIDAQFIRRYPTLDDVPQRYRHDNAKDPYSFSQLDYTAMRLADFIRTEDNSLIGFRTRLPASFRNDD